MKYSFVDERSVLDLRGGAAAQDCFVVLEGAGGRRIEECRSLNYCAAQYATSAKFVNQRD
jgi:hypothetical protein